MALAVRAVSVRKGVDPRDAAMIAFGGAGPVHAAALCKEINIPILIIPKMPGNFSALGMLLAPWRHDFVRTTMGVLGQLQPAWVESAFDELVGSAHAQLRKDALAPALATLSFAADLRYRGQETSSPVPFAASQDLNLSLYGVRKAFHYFRDSR